AQDVHRNRLEQSREPQQLAQAVLQENTQLSTGGKVLTFQRLQRFKRHRLSIPFGFIGPHLAYLPPLRMYSANSAPSRKPRPPRPRPPSNHARARQPRPHRRHAILATWNSPTPPC